MDYVIAIIKLAVRNLNPDFTSQINVLEEISRETAAYGLPNTFFDGIILRSR